PRMRDQMKLYAERLASQFPDLNATRDRKTEVVWPRLQSEALRIVEREMPEPVSVAQLRRKRRQKLLVTWTIAILVGVAFFWASSESLSDAFVIPLGFAFGAHLIILFNDLSSFVLRETQAEASSRLAAHGLKDFQASVLVRQARERKN